MILSLNTFSTLERCSLGHKLPRSGVSAGLRTNHTDPFRRKLLRMARSVTARTLLGLGIAALVVLWIVVLRWALKNNAIPHIFATSSGIFSHVASFMEYRTAHGLTYQKGNHNEPKFPHYFKLGDLLAAWNPDDTSPARWQQSAAHPSRGQGVARFDYSDEKQRKIALEFRDQEIPFVVYNIPELDRAITETFTPAKLLENIGDNEIDVERIATNNYLYYHAKRLNQVKKHYRDWTPPQEDIVMTYPQFLKEVAKAEARPDYVNSSIPLYYFTISAMQGKTTGWIRKALPFFDPTPSFFMVDVRDYKGINCRFGMKGVAAAAHYDGRRNMVAMLRGRKRYILQPPSECDKLELYERGHPSARHSRIDWSNMDEVKRYPRFYDSKATEIILSMGEILYIPGNWFHYIVSQDASIQCNARSGTSHAPSSSLGDCGM